MNKRLVLILIIVGVALAVTFGVLVSQPLETVVDVSSSNPPNAPTTSLNGDSHNFGIVWLDDGPSPQQHEFEIRNDSDKTLKVAGLSVSCECVTTTFDKKTLSPGETGRLKVEMDLPGAVYRDAEVWLNFGDDGLMTLHVFGTGRRTINLSTWDSIVKLLPSEDNQNNQLQADVILFASIYDDGALPVDPEVQMPEELQVEFLGWEKMTENENQLPDKPVMWKSTLRFTELSTVTEPCFILITVGKGAYAKVALEH